MATTAEVAGLDTVCRKVKVAGATLCVEDTEGLDTISNATDVEAIKACMNGIDIVATTTDVDAVKAFVVSDGDNTGSTVVDVDAGEVSVGGMGDDTVSTTVEVDEVKVWATGVATVDTVSTSINVDVFRTSVVIVDVIETVSTASEVETVVLSANDVVFIVTVDTLVDRDADKSFCTACNAAAPRCKSRPAAAREVSNFMIKTTVGKEIRPRRREKHGLKQVEGT